MLCCDNGDTLFQICVKFSSDRLIVETLSMYVRMNKCLLTVSRLTVSKLNKHSTNLDLFSGSSTPATGLTSRPISIIAEPLCQVQKNPRLGHALKNIPADTFNIFAHGLWATHPIGYMESDFLLPVNIS